MNDPAGVAFIGAGFIAYMHLLAVRNNPHTKLVALASRSPRVAEHRARIFDTETYTFDTMDEMLARDDIDIVCILSPNYLHAGHSLKAIEAGKHIILEKPMTVTLAEADEVINAAQSAGVGIGYAENQVYAPLLVRAREAIAGGAIGAIRSATGVCGHSGPSPAGWFRKPEFAGGGAHIDLGSHTLESILYLIGKPAIKRVNSCTMAEAPEGGIDGKGEAMLETENGITIEMTSSWLEEDDEFYYEVEGDTGRIRAVFSPPPQFLTLYRDNGETENIEVPGQFDMQVDKYLASNGYVGQLADFESCFREGTTPTESGADGRNVLRILLAGYMSAAGECPVELSADIPTDRTPVQLWPGD